MSEMAVVIPVFNQVHLTKRCFASMVEGASSPHEIIVVDNHSTDDTPRYLQGFRSEAAKKGWKVQIITNNENRGVSAAFNQGIKAATTKFITLANNDTWLMPGWDSACLRRIKELKAHMVGAYYYEKPFDEMRTPPLAQKFVQRNKNKVSNWWSSILMMFDRTTFDQVGLFDERYFVSYEDRDMKERMDRAGLKYYTIADCFIWHFSKGTRGAQSSRYETESLAKFIEKWGFDPRVAENKKMYRYKRKWTLFKNRLGYF